MEWLNIKTSDLHAPEFIGSDPKQRATWLSVICYCVEQENFGKIENSRDWKCRRWQQTCGVTLKEVDNATLLLMWNNNDLTVWKYPIDKQKLVQDKRVTAQINGQKGGRPRNEPETNIETNVGFQTKPRLEPMSESGRERKGSGIGKEVEPEGKGMSAEDRQEIMSRIIKMFGRTKSFTRDEMETLMHCGIEKSEVVIIEAWFEKSRRLDPSNKLPQSVSSLLENWQKNLDRAGNFNPHTNGNHKNGSSESARNIGTANEGRASQYRGVGKINPQGTNGVSNPQ